MYMYLSGVGFAAEQNELIAKVYHGVVLHREIVGLVVAAALVR